MILHEYAVEPGCVVGWDRFNHITNYFGYRHGRLISRFPKQWMREVVEACKELKDVEKKRIVERLADDKFKLEKTTPANREYNSSDTWINNAVRQHAVKNFKAIMAVKDVSYLNYVVGVDDVAEHHPLIAIPREDKVDRSPSTMAQCIAPLLENSTEILFVDANFSTSRAKWPNALKEFLQLAGCGKTLTRCEYHLMENQNPGEGFCKDDLIPKIPKGIRVKFIIWNYDEEVPKDFHPRYILTDLGGTRFDYGLDGPQTGTRTDVSMLDNQLWQEAWKDFQRETARFNFVSEIEIIGQG